MKKLYVGLLGLSLIWGTSFLFIKILVDSLGIWEVVFWRSFFGAIILWIIFFFKERKRLKQLPWGLLALIGITNNAIPWGMIALSETVISSSLASVLNATTPIWTSVIGFLFFSRKMNKKHWIGIVVGFCGIIVLANVRGVDLFSGNIIGIGTMLIAAICYGFSSQFTKKYLNNISSLTLAAVTLSFSSLASLSLALLNEPIHFTVLTEMKSFLAFIGLGAFGSGVAIYIFYFLIQEGSAEFASTVTYLVPITALFWGMVFLHEVITLHMLLGLILVFLGVYLSTYKRKQKIKAVL